MIKGCDSNFESVFQMLNVAKSVNNYLALDNIYLDSA